MKRLKRKFLLFLKKVLNYIKIPGLNGLGLFDLLKIFMEGLLNGFIGSRAAAVSYSLFMSLFPFVIFLFSLLLQFELSDDLQRVFEETILTRLFPGNSYNLSTSLESIVGGKNFTILSTGFLLSILFTTNGINALISGFNLTYHKLKKRHFVEQYCVALLLTITFTLFFILMLFIIYYASPLSRYIEEKQMLYVSDYSDLISGGLAGSLTTATFFLNVSLLYKYGPKTKFSFKEILPGSIFVTLFFILTFWGFGIYLKYFAQYKTLYNSLGTILVLMLWIYINVIIIITGFELNATFYITRHLRNDSIRDDLKL
ncbi:MAG: YihY/virulence factor BrkB family protein [Flavobacteriales bacterium]